MKETLEIQLASNVISSILLEVIKIVVKRRLSLVIPDLTKSLTPHFLGVIIKLTYIYFINTCFFNRIHRLCFS